MESQKDDYDIFIYCEDDLLFTKKNFQYWLAHKDKCIQKCPLIFGDRLSIK